jgi:hypothetical protein
MNRSIQAFMALGLLILSGCTKLASPPTITPAPTEASLPTLATSTDELIGVWKLGSGPRTLFFRFDEDGSYRMALGVVTNLEGSPQHFGQYKFEGGLLTFITNDESPVCAGQSGTYEVRLLKQRQLALALREDQCSIRADSNFSPLEPYSP